MDFGCLPFELFRFLASIALGVLFSTAMWRHRATLLPVHRMIFGVVVLGTVESLSWLSAYSYMNSTGETCSRQVKDETRSISSTVFWRQSNIVVIMIARIARVTRRPVVARKVSSFQGVWRCDIARPYPTRPDSTLLRPTLPYLILPSPPLPYPTLPYAILPYPSIPCPTLLNPTLPYPTLPYPTLPYPTLPYPG